MWIKTLTQRAIWSYQAYSSTTCSSQRSPFMTEDILPWFFFEASTDSLGALILPGYLLVLFALSFSYNKHQQFSMSEHLPFTIPALNTAIMEVGYFPFWEKTYLVVLIGPSPLLLKEKRLPLPLTMNKYKSVLRGSVWYLDLVRVQEIQWYWPQRKPTSIHETSIWEEENMIIYYKRWSTVTQW